MDNLYLVLLQLLAAHLITDFVLQPGSWIVHKRKFKAKSLYLYLHAFLAGFLSLVFLLNFNLWYVGLAIAVTHFFIDLWKLNQPKDDLKTFLLDQLLHLIIIGLAWLYIISGFQEVGGWISQALNSTKFLAITLAYLFVIFPAGYLIGKATRRWQDEVESTQKQNSLEAAGRYIGIFERILILSFILTQNLPAIGFLIAAKSILRFSDKSDTGARKQTEYVLIGTLMSFAITILAGLLVNYIAFQ